MVTALEEKHMSPAQAEQATTRVTLREIRERSFRALRTAGAGCAEARIAAEQILFAELHHGTGLTEVLAELSAGPWGRTELLIEPEELPERFRVRSTGEGRISALRHGASLIELIAAEPQTSVLLQDGLTPLSGLLDEPLTRVAPIVGNPVSAWELAPHTTRIRTALPDGTLGFGVADPQGATAEALHGQPVGTVMLHTSPQTPPGEITWLSADQQQARRRAAATEGITVNTSIWKKLGAMAQNFLVPEQ